MNAEGLFSVHLVIEGEEHQAVYEDIVECLRDQGLRILFDSELVTESWIAINGQRITARPIITWSGLRGQMISNSSTIARAV